MNDPWMFRDALHQLSTVVATLLVYVLIDLLNRTWRRSKSWRRQSIERLSVKDDQINMLLAEIGSRLWADRAYLSMYHNGDHYVEGSELMKKTRTHEWTFGGVSPTLFDFHDIAISLLTEECKLVLEPGPSYTRVADLPDCKFKRLCEAQGVYAVARCAVRSYGKTVGFLGLDFIRHLDPPTDIDLLPIYASRIEFILDRHRA